jgi:xylan 1,4-beta-xylosidase
VETQDGETYMAYLCGRPLPNRGRCVLGRETAIQKMSGRRTAGSAPPTARACLSSDYARAEPAAASLPRAARARGVRLAGVAHRLPVAAHAPPGRIWSLTERPGFLRLFGRETLGSQFEQALVARRQQDHCFTASTRMEFQPEHFQQAAGLLLYYNATKFHYLHSRRTRRAGVTCASCRA